MASVEVFNSPTSSSYLTDDSQSNPVSSVSQMKAVLSGNAEWHVADFGLMPWNRGGEALRFLPLDWEALVHRCADAGNPHDLDETCAVADFWRFLLMARRLKATDYSVNLRHRLAYQLALLRGAGDGTTPGADADVAAEEYGWQMLTNPTTYPNADTSTSIRMIKVAPDLMKAEEDERSFYQVAPVNKLAKYVALVPSIGRPRSLMTETSRDAQLPKLVTTTNEAFQINLVLRNRRVVDRHRILFAPATLGQNLDRSAGKTLITAKLIREPIALPEELTSDEKEHQRDVVVVLDPVKVSKEETDTAKTLEEGEKNEEQPEQGTTRLDTDPKNGDRFLLSKPSGLELIYVRFDAFTQALAQFVTKLLDMEQEHRTRILREGKFVHKLQLAGRDFTFDLPPSDPEEKNKTSLTTALSRLSQPFSQFDANQTDLVFVARPKPVEGEKKQQTPTEREVFALVTKVALAKIRNRHLVIFPILLLQGKERESNQAKPVTFASGDSLIPLSPEQTKTPAYSHLSIVTDAEKENVRFGRRPHSVMGDGTRLRPLLLIKGEDVKNAYEDVIKDAV
jgi:hypothetical protein